MCKPGTTFLARCSGYCLILFLCASGPAQAQTQPQPNRTVPATQPLKFSLSFSANPTPQEFFQARVFEEPLVPIGDEPTAAENADLAAALLGYARRSGPDDFSALTGFLENWGRLSTIRHFMPPNNPREQILWPRMKITEPLCKSGPLSLVLGFFPTSRIRPGSAGLMRACLVVRAGSLAPFSFKARKPGPRAENFPGTFVREIGVSLDGSQRL